MPLFLRITFVAVVLSFASNLQATPGDLDTGFGSGGKVVTAVRTPADRGFAAVLQPDGKIVVAGQTSYSNDTAIALVRYNADGSLNSEFGVNGRVVTLPRTRVFAEAMALQPDGKIVVAGSSGSYPGDFALVRYNANGSLDTTFHGDGNVVTPVGSSNDYAHAVAIQPDGKILVAGESYNGSDADFALVRYNTDGSLDTTFDSDGKVITPIGSSSDSGYTLALQPDGKILVAGNSFNGTGTAFALVRYNADGSLDTTFDGDGKVVTSLGSLEDMAHAIALQPDGKILVAGSSGYQNSDFALVRYNADGSIDTTFHTDGKVVTPVGSYRDIALAMLLQPDGKILVTGYSWNGTGSNYVLVRYNADGTPDNSLNGSGKVVMPSDAATPYHEGRAMALQPDGKVVVAGSSGSRDGGTRFALVRFNSDGSLDTGLGGDGEVCTEITFLDDMGSAIALQPDGKILVAGYSYNGTDNDVALLRYNSDGTPDTRFAGNGAAIQDYEDDYGYAIALQPDGKILVAGASAYFSCYRMMVRRFTANGDYDPDFGLSGAVFTSIGGTDDVARAIAVQPDGKILVAGPSRSGVTYEMALVRYNPDGSLDTTFDGDGKAVASAGGVDDMAYAIALQPDGKILVAGSSVGSTDLDFALVRFKPDGSLDTTFHGDGKVVTPMGAGDDVAFAMVLQPDGKILVAGRSTNGTDNDFALARYNTDGSLDTTFDGDGKVLTPTGPYDDIASAIALQPDGKILVAGTSAVYDNDFSLARYNPDGSLDSTFHGDGKVITQVGSAHDIGSAVALQPNGRILVAGSSYSGTDYDFALVQYVGTEASPSTGGGGGGGGGTSDLAWLALMAAIGALRLVNRRAALHSRDFDRFWPSRRPPAGWQSSGGRIQHR